MDRFDCQYMMAVFVNVYIASFIRYENWFILQNKLSTLLRIFIWAGFLLTLAYRVVLLAVPRLFLDDNAALFDTKNML